MPTLVVIPAYQARRHLGTVLAELRQEAEGRLSPLSLLVVDDGSTDATDDVAIRAGVECVRHESNLGKGAAIRTGLTWAKDRGYTAVVSADADGQHPASEILRLVDVEAPVNAIVLGVRDLVRDGAPKASQFSNGLSNRFLSCFAGMRLLDTQCGLRRYPVSATLALRCQDPGYAFEAEVVLRAARKHLPILQLPIRVRYPKGPERVSHFRVSRDPLRIISRVVTTLLE